MTKEMFKECLEVMLNAHTPNKPKEKLAAYYHFFEKETSDVLVAASEECARDCERWPSIRQFGETLKKYRSKSSSNAVGCDFCNSSGLVNATDNDGAYSYAFRCHCLNAARYQNINPWTKETAKRFKITRTHVKIMSNTLKTKRGLSYIKSVHPPDSVIRKIEDLIEQGEKEIPF